MADEPAKTPIQNKYAQQYSDDLAANREEQTEVIAQIAGLQERLDQLKAEEAWLAQAQGSLPGAAVSSAPEDRPATGAAEVPQEATAEEADTSAPAEEATGAAQTVPQQRQDQPVKEAQPKQPARRTAAAKKTATAKKATGRKAAEKATAGTTAKKATAKKAAAEPAKKAAAKKASAEPAKKATAKKAAAKKVSAGKVPAQQAAAAPAPAGGAAGGEKSGPPLWQLILDILRKTPGQPCVAREVHDQLAQDHPSRKTSAQTVRNNLQTLVQKGLAEKSRQQGNVMYTAYADTAANAVSAADGTADGKADQAPEKVPAEA
ncbi:BlaI/MecI/CopY family transcriptional regulator [Streptomyces sp. NPDC014684]|uniref:BlaI/MecI/CopY family transcriptional regulator n=1 Tax=Streptomyces sp. NPDC014684 TaxID=3364880 RepID=UPI0036F54D8E